MMKKDVVRMFIQKMLNNLNLVWGDQGRKNWKPRQESERDSGMTKMELDKDNFCCWLLSFWKQENKSAGMKIVTSVSHGTIKAWSGVGRKEISDLRIWDSGEGIIDMMRWWCGEMRTLVVPRSRKAAGHQQELWTWAVRSWVSANRRASK